MTREALDKLLDQAKEALAAGYFPPKAIAAELKRRLGEAFKGEGGAK